MRENVRRFQTLLSQREFLKAPYSYPYMPSLIRSKELPNAVAQKIFEREFRVEFTGGEYPSIRVNLKTSDGELVYLVGSYVNGLYFEIFSGKGLFEKTAGEILEEASFVGGPDKKSFFMVYEEGEKEEEK